MVYIIICNGWTSYLNHINFIIVFEAITQQSEHESMVIDSVAELEDPVGPLVGSNTHKTLVGDLLNIRKLSLTLPGEVKVVSLPCGEWKIYTDILVHMESSIADILITSANKTQ